jgi:hypothetical protein
MPGTATAVHREGVRGGTDAIGGGVLARRSVLKPMREDGRYGGLGGVARRAAAKYATM